MIEKELSNSMITIEAEVSQFDYFNNGEPVGTATVGTLITDSSFIDQTFPYRQVIGFRNKKGKYISVDLGGKTEDTISKALYWANFSDQFFKIFLANWNLN